MNLINNTTFTRVCPTESSNLKHTNTKDNYESKSNINETIIIPYIPSDKLSPSAQRKLANEFIVSASRCENKALLIDLVIWLSKVNFTDTTAQLQIIDAVTQGEFGKNTQVLMVLADFLSKMKCTDNNVPARIATAIIDFQFGTNTEVLSLFIRAMESMEHGQFAKAAITRTIIHISSNRWKLDGIAKIDLLKSLLNLKTTIVEECIVTVISENINPANRKQLIKLLDSISFTSNFALKFVSEAISNGQFGNSTAVLQLLVKIVLNDNFDISISSTNVMEHVTELIKNGEFGNEVERLEKLIRVIERMDFNASERIQIHIADAIARGQFGITPSVLDDLIGLLSKFTNDTAIISISWAVAYSKFGSDKDLLLKLINALSRMNLEQNKTASMFIAKAMKDNLFLFKGYKESQEKLANLLPKMNFEESKTQIYIITAIKNKCFYDIKKHLVNMISGIKFTNEEAQIMIAESLHQGIFGKDALDVVAYILSNFNLANETIQKHITHALYCDTFGNDLNGLTSLLTRVIAMMEMINATAQNNFTSAIAIGVFGENDSVVDCLLDVVLEMTFTDAKSQADIINFFNKSKEKFKNAEKCKQLGSCLQRMNILDPRVQIETIKLVKSIRFPYRNNDFIKSLLSNWLVTPETFNRIIKIANLNSSDYDLFGIRMFDNMHTPPLYINNTITDYCFEQNRTGTYGRTYDPLNNHKLLIVYNGDNATIFNESFNMFINPHTGLVNKNIHLNQITVYDISNPHNAYPIKMNLNQQNIGHFPPWLQHEINTRPFNIQDYASHDLFEFVFNIFAEFEKMLNQDDKYFSQICVETVQIFIKVQGDMIKLSRNPYVDMEAKNKINELLACENIQSDNYIKFEAMLDAKWATLNDENDLEQKIKLAYFLSQIASRNCLGFHYGDDNVANPFNVANTLFYKLAKHCFNKIAEEIRDMNVVEDNQDNTKIHTTIDNICGELNYGSCIEAATTCLITNYEFTRHFGIVKLWNEL